MVILASTGPGEMPSACRRRPYSANAAAACLPGVCGGTPTTLASCQRQPIGVMGRPLRNCSLTVHLTVPQPRPGVTPAVLGQAGSADSHRAQPRPFQRSEAITHAMLSWRRDRQMATRPVMEKVSKNARRAAYARQSRSDGVLSAQRRTGGSARRDISAAIAGRPALTLDVRKLRRLALPEWALVRPARGSGWCTLSVHEV